MKLYLDEMISPKVAESLRRRGHDVAAAAERDALGKPDAHQLAVAIAEQRALVTFDIADFAALANAAASSGTGHWGIVFASPARFSADRIGELVMALERLIARPAGFRTRSARPPW